MSAAFSPSEAAFAGFRFIRERPRAFLIWIGAFLTLKLVSALFAASPLAKPLYDLNELAQRGEMNLGTVMAIGPQLLPMAMLSVALSMAGLCVVAPSIMRAMMRTDDRAMFHLGRDEGRMLVLFFFEVVIIFGISLVLAVSLGLIAILAGGLGMARLVLSLAALAGLLMPFVVMIRLSVAAPLIIDTHHIDLMRSLRLTRGNFWRLTWSFVLALVMASVIAIAAWALVSLVAMVAVLVSGGGLGDIASWRRPQGEDLAAHFAPGPLLGSLVYAALEALFACVTIGTVVHAYRALRDRRDAAAQG